MRPLRVTAVLSDGRLATSDGRLALDSILAYTGCWSTTQTWSTSAGRRAGAIETDLSATLSAEAR